MNTVVTLLSRAEDYLAERRRLGYASCSEGGTIKSFARYVDDLGHEGPLTVELMAAWARRGSGDGERPTQRWARRLKTLRGFTRWMRQFEPRTEVPDDSIFGRIGERRAPHIFTEQEIIDLLGAARRLKPTLRGATYEALFGLIAATGLRVSEALCLLDTDVDLRSGLLTVRCTKFRKSRHVVLHPSTTAALRRYRRRRDLQITRNESTPFFVGTRGRRLGTRLSLRQVDRVFGQLREPLGWVNRGAHPQIRIHDLRHSFIVARMLRWQVEGVDIDQSMLALSTYVGHAIVTNTYWYLTGVPELMAVAASRFEPFSGTEEVNRV